ncbi:MAG TPA: GAF domain-containing protein [Anaeromyxobacter sp.]
MPDDHPRKAEELAASAVKHGRDLQEVNARLRELISSLQLQKGRLAAGMRLGEARQPAPAAPEASAAATGNGRAEGGRAQLESALADARAEAEHSGVEHAKLLRRLADIEEENRRACDEYAALQERTTEVMQLFVTLERLHRGLTRGETLAALQEIVINILGSEELAFLEPRDGALHPLHTFGVRPEALAGLRPGLGALGRAAQGRPWIASRDPSGELAPDEADLTVALPLRAGESVVAVLAVFRLLPHKPSLTDADLEVLSLLECHAGTALALRPAAAAAA